MITDRLILEVIFLWLFQWICFLLNTTIFIEQIYSNMYFFVSLEKTERLTLRLKYCVFYVASFSYHPYFRLVRLDFACHAPSKERIKIRFHLGQMIASVKPFWFRSVSKESIPCSFRILQGFRNLLSRWNDFERGYFLFLHNQTVLFPKWYPRRRNLFEKKLRDALFIRWTLVSCYCLVKFIFDRNNTNIHYD